MARKRRSTHTTVTSTKHADKRTNIPTEELRDFIAQDESAPQTVRYPRDPSLDPQLVWKGKDTQDGEDLVVPAVPIYIQEKIHPHAIIEDLKAHADDAMDQAQLSLFDDFNGIDFEDLVEFYQHDQNWTNRMILGDSLQVMTSLAEKEGLKDQVQMIYIDPPYGIKFGSNWQVSTRKRQVRDGKAEDTTRQPEQVKAFRDTWELGIHSYLAYLRDRFVVARDLLTETGSIFVQIGDENVHLVRCVLDEVFGSENFVSQVVFAKTTGFAAQHISNICDHLLWYAKSRDHCKVRPLWNEKQAGEAGASKYRFIDSISAAQMTVHDPQQMGVSDQLTSQGPVSTEQEFGFQGRTWTPPSGMHWKTTVEGLSRLGRAGRVMIEGSSIRYLRLLRDSSVSPISNMWMDIGGIQSRTDPKVYVVQTATEASKRCLLMTTDPGDLVLDPTCGSGTTAYVAEQWGRRWITIDTSRVAVALARTRLMSARYPYYLLTDSSEGLLKTAEITGVAPSTPLPQTREDVKQGFVYQRAPHIMLRDIAHNEEIDVIYARWEETLAPLRAEINAALGQAWEPWEMPREGDGGWPADAKRKLATYWQKRRQRQTEIDASIARHSQSEILYDRPYEDGSRLRVTGPFTVESLSPHRVISTDAALSASEAAGRQAEVTDFATMVIENLKAAGVQNTRKQERLTFDSLEPYAGQWIQAAGEYTDADETIRRVAVAIGPEHGTVGPTLLKEAAKEAVRGVGFDLVVVCGFAFDPHVAEEATRYGALTVLPVRMNPDLAMGDSLLKKTGAGNLFMVFGEPDVRIRRQNEQLVVEILGVDIYDPTTGEIRANSTDDIACWFIDTAYNEESFFVRHAYFTGADRPYDNLKRALRAEIDEEAWATLYRTVSRPFDPPDTGKIAVKVINHYGDEVLKVYEV